MNSPAISFISEIIPENKLEKSIVYRYYPVLSMKDQILNDVKQHLKCDLEEYIVEVKVEVTLKLYKTN